MAKDFAHNGPAITVVVVVASGLGVLMAYAIGRFWVTQRNKFTDLEENRDNEVKQVDHMRDVRNRNRATIAGTYGFRMGAPSHDQPRAWRGQQRSGTNSYVYEDNSAYEWAPAGKGGYQAHVQESWDDAGVDAYPDAGVATPVYEDRYSPAVPAKSPIKESAQGAPAAPTPEIKEPAVESVEIHANEKQ